MAEEKSSARLRLCCSKAGAQLWPLYMLGITLRITQLNANTCITIDKTFSFLGDLKARISTEWDDYAARGFTKRKGMYTGQLGQGYAPQF